MKNIIFNGYEDYQHSGVTWLGSAPKSWGVMKIKNIYHHFGSGSTPLSSEPKYYDDGDVNWLNTTDLKNTIVTETKNKITRLALAELSMKVYPKNALAIAMYGQGDTRGSVGLLNIESTTNQAACIMYGSKNSIPKFMFWWFVSQKSNIRKINVGATQPNMNQDFVRNLFIALPSIPEQQAIADYLDAKTAHIDRKIELLEAKAEKYVDLKQSLINETVTRGLSKTVPMKDSGVEWIGEIPSHWEMKRIKDLFHGSKNKVGSKSGLYKILSLTQNGVIERDIESGKGKFPATFDGYQIVNPDSLLLCLFDMDVTPRIVGYVSQVGLVTSAYTNIIGNASTFAKYYYYYFLNQDRNKSLLANGKGLRSTLTFDSFSLLRLPLPPLEEQKAIAEYLESKTAQIEKIVETIYLEVEALKELRKTLINDVVTGKIRVI